MLTSKQIAESERLDAEIGPRPDCRRESLMPNRFTRTKTDAEHQRLQSAVVEAASAWARSFGQTWTTGEAEEDELIKAADALIAFKAEHKIGVE